jgi:hypothetical protein
VKYIPSNTIRIPLKVFSRIGPEGMIRLPTSDEEAAHIGETFSSNSAEDPPQPFHDEPHEARFHDDDDDIPPVVPKQTVKLQENEEDFFDVSDDEDENEVRPAGQDDGTNAWRD